MGISTLQINNVRNLQSVNITPDSRFNLIYGQNGSGKTSLLEAIYLLGHGRSFRSYSASPVINREENKLTIFAELNSANGHLIPLGLERSRTQSTRIRIAHQEINSIAEIARLLPLQVVSSESYHILESGPKYRRRFLDWGLFHVEHTFFSCWKTLQSVIQQRNAALKSQQKKNEVQLWDPQLIDVSNKINQMRKQYIESLTPVIYSVFMDLIPQYEFSFEYHRGWDKNKEYEFVLNESLERDYKLGYTQHGPHRADLLIKVGQHVAEAVLSRGQQKTLVNSLQLAQGILLKQLTNKECIYLIDDFSAELDETKKSYLANVLNQIEAQVFITTIDPMGVINLFPKGTQKRFHVEHGLVIEG